MTVEQRQRLLRAMTDTVAEHGYASSTVAEIVSRAGVSRKVFYEHFAGKRECFLAGYDETLSGYLRAIAGSFSTDGDRAERAQTGLKALFETAAADPAALRLVTIEIAGVGEEGIARREALISGFEAFLRESLSLASGLGTLPNPVLRAVVGGLSRILHARVQDGKHAELLRLVPDLVAWASSYSRTSLMAAFRNPPPSTPSASEGLWGGRAPGTLSGLSSASVGNPVRARRGRSLSHGFRVHSQQELIIDAVANLTAENGYAGLTLTAIAEKAGVSLPTFHQHFTGKEDAFLVAYEIGHAKGLAVAERAFSSESDWRLGVRAGVSALYDFLASEPSFARLALVEALIATRRSAERSSLGVTGYARMLLPGLQEAPERSRPPAVVIEAISGGIFELCRTYALKGRVDELSEIVPRTTFFALAPFIGAEEAAVIATGTC
jgi:AcrR family transcriptional regulator